MIKLSLWYLLIIGVFSFVYWFIYLFDTSSFIVEKQFNLKAYGILELREQLNENGEIEYNYPKDIAEYVESIYPLHIEYNRVNDEIDSLNTKIKSITAIIDSITPIFSKSREEDINRQLKIYVKPEQKSLDSIQQIIHILLEEYPNEGERIAITSGLYVQEAQINLALVSKEVDFRNWVLKNHSSFGDKALNDSLSHYNTMILELNNAITKLKEKSLSLKSDIFNKNQKFHLERIRQVTYWDFLYFSFTTGFTNNFGDIIPNNTKARIAVTLHIFISIIAIAVLLEKIVKIFWEHRRE